MSDAKGPASRLDLSGLTCPVPLLRTKRHLRTMASGQLVAVTTTDPDSKADFLAYCDGRTSRVVNIAESAGRFEFLIEKL